MKEIEESIMLYTRILLGARSLNRSIADQLKRGILTSEELDILLLQYQVVFETYFGRLSNEIEFEYMTAPLHI